MAQAGVRPARGRDHEPHARARLRERDRPRDRRPAEGPPLELRAVGLRRRGRPRRAGRDRAPPRHPRSSRTSAAARSSTWRPNGLPDETFAPARIETGADLVCFSGDKLLGGPQAGLILGSEEAVSALATTRWGARCGSASSRSPRSTGRCARSPRACGRSADVAAAAGAGRTRRRPRADAARTPREATAGGRRRRTRTRRDARPGRRRLRSRLHDAEFGRRRHERGRRERAASRLRNAPVPVVGRVEDGRVLLDARTLLPGDDEAIETAFATIEAARRTVAAFRIDRVRTLR